MPQVITAGDQSYVLGRDLAALDLQQRDGHRLRPGSERPRPAAGLRGAGRRRRHRRVCARRGDVVEPPAELRARAEEAGINPDLVLAGNRRYLLVNLWSPIGTTTNGWVTLYSATGEGVADTLLATDPRSLDLFVYHRSGAPVG